MKNKNYLQSFTELSSILVRKRITASLLHPVYLRFFHEMAAHQRKRSYIYMWIDGWMECNE